MSERIGRLENRLDKLADNLSAVDKAVTKIDEKVSNIEQNMVTKVSALCWGIAGCGVITLALWKIVVVLLNAQSAKLLSELGKAVHN